MHLGLKNYDSDKNLRTRKEFHQRFVRPAIDIGKRVAEALSMKGNENILDVGCGYGDFLKIIYRRGHRGRLVGVDISRKILPFSRKIEFKVMNAGKLHFPDNYFDIIICKHVLYHVPHILKALKEIHRVLKPHGRLVVTTNSVKGRTNILKRDRIIQALLGAKKQGTSARFNVENAARYLKKYFAKVKLRKFRGFVRLKSAREITKYISTFRNMWNPTPSVKKWKQVLKLVHKDIEQEIQRKGFFKDTVIEGMFICTKT